MPAEFGAPAKVAITENNNKILIQLLSYDTSGKLTNIVSDTLRQNVATYLSNYRMMNDYISILTAEVIDLSVDVQIVLDSAQNSGQIIADVVDKISTYFNPQIRQLGQNVYLSEIKSIVQNQNGVLTVAGLNVYNNVGGQYSSAETSMQYSDPETKEIAPVDDTIFAQPSQVYQIRYPNKDIRVSVKNFQSVTFS
jgi:S-methylmethionine-dependent homocysteine/selenocysteine methylase